MFPLLRAEFDVSFAALGALVGVFYFASGIDAVRRRLRGRPLRRASRAAGRPRARWPAARFSRASRPAIAWLYPIAALMGIGNGVFHPVRLRDPERERRAAAARPRLQHARHRRQPGLRRRADRASTALGSALGWRPALAIFGLVGLVALALIATQRAVLTSHKAQRRAHRTRCAAARICSCSRRSCCASAISFSRRSPVSACRRWARPRCTSRSICRSRSPRRRSPRTCSAARGGILAGGFLAARTEHHDRVAATGLCRGRAAARQSSATGATPSALLLPVFALTGFALGATGPVARSHRPQRDPARRRGTRLRFRLLGPRRRRDDRADLVRGDARSRARPRHVLRGSRRCCWSRSARCAHPARARRQPPSPPDGVTRGSRHRRTTRARLCGEQGTRARLRRGARRRGLRGDDRRADRGRAARDRERDRRARSDAKSGTSLATSRHRKAAQRRSPRVREPDILVNNAGGPPPGDFRDWDRAAWIRALDANMLTPIELIKATVDAMIARKFGRIVNITSGAVKAPIEFLGLSNGARSGLTGFVAGLARSVARHNVTINNLLPGPFDTDRLRTTMASRAKASGKSFDEAAGGGARGEPRRRASARSTSSARPARSCAACTPASSSARTCCSTAGSIRARSDGRCERDDRSLLLDDAERPQDHDLPRGDGACLHAEADQHLEGRAVRSGVSQDRAEQPDPGDRRSRAGRRRRRRCR